MYYIINETHDIIAADESLLTLCGFSQTNELTSSITLEKTILKTMPDNQVMISSEFESHTFPATYIPLSSLLGKLTLITLDTNKKISQSSLENIPLKATSEEKTDNEESININSLIIKSQNPNDSILINDIEKEVDLSLISKEMVKKEAILPPINVPLDLLTPEVDYRSTKPLKNKEITRSTDIIIDVTKVSQEIGISEEDFTLFLNEYIDTALDLEKDLESNDKEKRSTSLTTLLHLSDVLHLDEVYHILQDIDKSTEDTHRDYVTAFYDALSCITTKKDDTLSMEGKEKNTEDVALLDLLLDEDDDTLAITDLELHTEPVTKEIIETIPLVGTRVNTEEEPSLKRRDAIDLSAVTPIHFDFQITTAADELSLPQNLIEEFMIDFIDQAHTETEKMLVAYQAEDLNTIQKIGHLLKGVSSNLHINTLSDTLYNIQFSKDIDNIPHLIKIYWGHFLFFEKQIKRLTN